MRVLTALAVGVVAFCCSGLCAEQEEGPVTVQKKQRNVGWCGCHGHNRGRLWRWRGPTGPMGPQGPAGQDSTVPGPAGDIGNKGNPGPTGIVQVTNYVETVANFSNMTYLPEVFPFSIYPIFTSPWGKIPLALPQDISPALPLLTVSNGFSGLEGSITIVPDKVYRTFYGVKKASQGLCEIDFDVDFLTISPDPFRLMLSWGPAGQTAQTRTFWFTPVTLAVQPPLPPYEDPPGAEYTYYGVTGSRRAIIEMPADSELVLQTGVNLDDELYTKRLRFRKSADTCRLSIRQIQPLPLPLVP